MNVTPSTMARAVSARRSLWASSPLKVTPTCQLPSVLHALEHRVGGRVGQVAHDLAVGQEHHPVGIGRAVGVVGDHDDGLAELGHRAAQEGQHLGGGVRVQVARRLVGEDQLGPADEGPGAGAALLLAAGHLVGPVR